MPRAAKGAARTKARKRILRAARGYWGTRSRHKQQAKITLTRAGAYAWRDRRAPPQHATFVDYPHHGGLSNAWHALQPLYEWLDALWHLLNRKMLSEIAIHDPATFDLLVEKSEAATKAPAANA